VLPAVEAMEILASRLGTALPGVDGLQIQAARFDKFLPLDKPEAMELWGELESEQEGGVRAALKSKRRGKRGIARTLTHAAMSFGGAETGPTPVVERIADSAEQIRSPTPQRIYTELVPFGPGYRNLRRITAFGPGGIRAQIVAPRIESPFFLGSPFVLDAAFHAACVWGQRYAGVVAFPVGLGRRRVLRPCEAGKRYEAVIRVVRVVRVIGVGESGPASLRFDIAIKYQGALCEVVTAVRMKDVSGGRLKPPAWIRTGGDSGAGG
jgi:hypothetical protein